MEVESLDELFKEIELRCIVDGQLRQILKEKKFGKKEPSENEMSKIGVMFTRFMGNYYINCFVIDMVPKYDLIGSTVGHMFVFNNTSISDVYGQIEDDLRTNDKFNHFYVSKGLRNLKSTSTNIKLTSEENGPNSEELFEYGVQSVRNVYKSHIRET